MARFMSSKFEYRITKFETISNDKNLNDQNILIVSMVLKNFFTCLELLDIRISYLFRISIFGFRIYSLFCNRLTSRAFLIRIPLASPVNPPGH